MLVCRLIFVVNARARKKGGKACDESEVAGSVRPKTGERVQPGQGQEAAARLAAASLEWVTAQGPTVKVAAVGVALVGRHAGGGARAAMRLEVELVRRDKGAGGLVGVGQLHAVAAFGRVRRAVVRAAVAHAAHAGGQLDGGHGAVAGPGVSGVGGERLWRRRVSLSCLRWWGWSKKAAGVEAESQAETIGEDESACAGLHWLRTCRRAAQRMHGARGERKRQGDKELESGASSSKP